MVRRSDEGCSATPQLDFFAKPSVLMPQKQGQRPLIRFDFLIKIAPLKRGKIKHHCAKLSMN